MSGIPGLIERRNRGFLQAVSQKIHIILIGSGKRNALGYIVNVTF